MGLIEILTPKNTIEIKKGLFIQKTPKGWKQIHPACWNAKINWKNFIFGGSIIKPTIVFIIILLLAYGYYSTNKTCYEFQENICDYLPNITSHCIYIGQEGKGDLIIHSNGTRRGEDNNSLQSYT